MHKRLFIPGPVEVSPEVLAQMATPMIGHRGKEAEALQGRISQKLQTLMYTKNLIVLSTSSGTGLMEGAVRSFCAKRTAVFSVGAFGKRWYELCQYNDVPADLYEVPLGQATPPEQLKTALQSGRYDLVTITHNETSTGVANDLDALAAVMAEFPEVYWAVDCVSSLGGAKIEVDRLGIDICISSSQKCLGLPPGLSLASVSERALKRAETVSHRGFYFDYVRLARFVREKPFQYPSTPSLAHYFALDYQLDRIMAEGPEQRFARHTALAERTREWAAEHFAVFADPKHLSATVTCISNNRGIDVAELNRRLGQQGYQISNGYGPLKNKTFRIAHMADCSRADLEALLDTLDAICADL
ncbi:MAG: alanine--glyoxylate aminotransferase family protein [Oscillospiraceae bacterium]|nr:alanine--glyoxylate aminotransferase family protein [Oscillospiraceae bacterium]MDD4367718.1 alanine--glyoxylate aminotransferase family protein [Oscillospiraceae bacterium]